MLLYLLLKGKGEMMIVRDIMTTKLTTVEPDDTLAHAASLLRQYQFHHLPVARAILVANDPQNARGKRQTALLFEGLLTSQDIDLAALSDQDQMHPWQERRVVEAMHRAIVRVTPTTPV